MSHNSRGIVPILVVLLVVGLIGVAGFLAFQNSQLRNKVPEVQDIPSPLPQKTTPPSPSPTTNPMSNWKTFQSSTYKVSYPPDMDTKEESGSILMLSKWGPTQKADTEFYDGISLRFQPLEILNITLADYVQAQVTDIKDVGISKLTSGPFSITLNGYKGLTYTEQGLGTFKTIVLESKGGTMFVEITDSTSDPGNLGFDKTVDQILSTFQFVE